MPERYLGHNLGRFRVDTLVGSGGFAWVYRGYDPELDIPVAIKILKPQFAGEESFESRFRLEASIAAKLRHPNIIRILAVGREDDAVHFVMDFLPSGLEGRLAELGRLPEGQLARMGVDVASALAFAHREGVIHRDIKVDNILFDDHGNAVVADFGIARAVSGYVEQTGTNMVVGTPQYVSPEQARGQPLDGRADIYSLGVTLFKAGTGALPFEGDDWYDTARRQIEELPPRPRELNAALSEEAERIILKCLAKERDARYSTSEELRADLVRLLGSSATPAALAASEDRRKRDRSSDATRPQPIWRRIRRTTLVLSGVAVLALAALIVDLARPREESVLAPPPPTPLLLPAVTVDAQPPLPTDSAAGAISGTLRVQAPAAAEVTVDGVSVGRGRWRSDSIAPGAHVVVATVPAPSGCPSARQESHVKVSAAGTTAVPLTPRPCGYLALDALPKAAKFTVTAAGGTRAAEGAATRHPPIMLPTGRYSLVVSAPYCAEFRAELAIKAGATRRQRVRLICR